MINISEFGEIFGSEILSTTGSIAAGIGLSFMYAEFSILPGLLIFLPGFLAMRGSITGSLSARVGSALHMGKIKPKFRLNAFLKANLWATFTLTLIISVTLGIAASFMNYFIFGGAFDYRLVTVAVMAGILSSAIQVPIAIISEIWFFKHKFNPDNIMGPFVTTTGDIVSVLSLFVTLLVVL